MSQVVPERRNAADMQRATPLSDLELMSERMRRMLDQTFGSLLAEPIGWAPPVDIEEQDDAYIVEAELPAVKREDVNIELVGNELTISGEIKEREREGILRKRTRRIGRFEYRVKLPDQTDPEQVDAKLQDGVLTVRIPKAQRAERRRIEVKAS